MTSLTALMQDTIDHLSRINDSRAVFSLIVKITLPFWLSEL